MRWIPGRHHWRAEGLRLAREPVAWIASAMLLAALLATAIHAGLETRAWRAGEARDAPHRAARLEAALESFRNGPPPGPARAVATYQLGRGELGATRMPTGPGLALGVQRLGTLPSRVGVSLDSGHAGARDPGPLRNPSLRDSGLPTVPAMVALLLPLAALALCAGLRQEEQEQGRSGLLRVQSRRGLCPVVAAALGWRFLALWAITAVGTVPALAMDPGADIATAAAWAAALGTFCGAWVAIGGLLSWAPWSGPASMLTGLALWLGLTFAVPAALVEYARRQAPMPSRLASIVEIREAQLDAEDREDALAAAWYASHPRIAGRLPAAWPASFLPRVLEQDRALRATAAAFRRARLEQAATVQRFAWISPGLALVLCGDRLAGTDAASHDRYLGEVEAFEARWRDHLVPPVMDLQGIGEPQLRALPAFAAGSSRN